VTAADRSRWADKGLQQRDALRAAWRRAGVYPNLTVGEAIDAGGTAHPDDRLVFARVQGETTSVTLRQFLAGARACAERLAGVGVHPGDSVIVQAPADLEGTEVLAAVWLLGAITVPVAAAATAEEVAHVATETHARWAIVAPEWRGRDLVTPLVEGLQLCRVVVVGNEAVDGAVALGSLEPLSQPSGARPDPSSVACILYTSGSTAVPKGVRHSHETLLCGLTVLPADSTSRMLGTFPAGHVAALLGLLRPSRRAARRW
jgi:acyl-coenzyme A synthetase/AMP-(fatty) acid ligase